MTFHGSWDKGPKPSPGSVTPLCPSMPIPSGLPHAVCMSLLSKCSGFFLTRGPGQAAPLQGTFSFSAFPGGHGSPLPIPLISEAVTTLPDSAHTADPLITDSALARVSTSRHNYLVQKLRLFIHHCPLSLPLPTHMPLAPCTAERALGSWVLAWMCCP